MAPRLDREAVNRKLRAERETGTAIYDALCGSGITAKMAARGGASVKRCQPIGLALVKCAPCAASQSTVRAQSSAIASA